MTWIKTFNRGQLFVHGVFIICLVASLSIVVFALRLNNLQQTEQDRILKINNNIEYFTNDQSFEKIGKLLSWTDSKKAFDKIKEFSQKVAESEELLNVKASEELSNSIRVFNRLINKTSGMSDPSDALKVLKKKLQSLKDVAESQKYKNIFHKTSKMINKVDQLNSRNVAESNLVNSLKFDLKKMEEVVVNSSLSDGEKNQIKMRLTSLSNEILIIASINSQTIDLKAHTTQASLALSEWILKISKQSSDIQAIRVNKQNLLVLLITGLAAFIALGWIGIAYLFRWQKNKVSNQIEDEIKSVVEKGILRDERFVVDHYSEITRNKIIGLLDELKIKLNLGSTLHEGLPFAGFMLDTEFKLVWYNNLLLEQFHLSDEEIKAPIFNWDYLRDYLNLSDDPVYSAMVNKTSGIFPVKIKQDELAPSQPFEMYVTPVTINREDRVLVFFYSLVSIKDSIKDQAEMLRQSIHRFITSWKEDNLDDEAFKIIERDFKQNDIRDIYEGLFEIYETSQAEKKELISLISNLEKEQSILLDKISYMKLIEDQKREIIRQEVDVANDLKAVFIATSERIDTLLNINTAILVQNDEMKNDVSKIQHQSIELTKKVKETREILNQVSLIKTDYKKLKNELLELKAKLISFNNSLFAQLPPFDESQQKLASRYKDELALLDFNVSTLDKKLSQLDVLLNKLSMMYDKTSFEQTNFNLITTQKDHETKETISAIRKNQNNDESRIVDQFKFLHQLIRQDLNKVENASEMLVENFEKFLEQ